MISKIKFNLVATFVAMLVSSIATAANVVKIGNVEYATFAESLAAAQNGDTITLIENVEVAASVDIPAGKEITLDLNYKTLSASGMNVLRNNEGSKLTIRNGTIERTGDIAGYAVNNSNTASVMLLEDVTIKGGVYTSGALTTTDANISQRFKDRHAIYASGCEVTLNSGTYHNYNAGNSAVFVANGATVTINGGTYSIDNGKQTLGWTSNLIDVNNGSCIMNGGDFKGHFRVQANGVLTINGGTFENTHGEGYQLYTGAVVNVKGGTFTDATAQKFAVDNLADGFELNAGGNVVGIPAVVLNASTVLGTIKIETVNGDNLAYVLGRLDVASNLFPLAGGVKIVEIDVNSDVVETENVTLKYNTVIKGNGSVAGTLVVVVGGALSVADTVNVENLVVIDSNGNTLIKDEDGSYTAAPVAKIGETPYMTLQAAFAAAQNGETIKLLSDLKVIGETFTIADGKAITLDMNGKKITATDNKAANVSYELFYIYGGLTITGNGTIELTSTSNDTAWAKSSTIFHNRGGVLTVENGTFTHLGGTAMAYVVDNNANSFGDAITYINGGTLTSSYIAIRMRMEDPNANGNPGNGISCAAVTGGYIYGANRGIWGQKSSGANEKQGQLTVTGGVVENGRTDRGAIQIDTDSYEAQNMLVSISGNATIKGAIMGGDDEFVVSGGTFTVEVPEKYCAEGFVCEQNADGTYGIVVDPTYGKVAKIGDAYYATLAEAIAAAQTGDEIVLLADIVLTEGVSLSEEKAITLDLNDKTITLDVTGKTNPNDIYAISTLKGKLTIKDSGTNGHIKGVVYTEATTVIEDGTFSAADGMKYTILNNGGNVTFNGGTVNGGASYAIYSYGNGHSLTINDVKVNGYNGCLYLYNEGDVTINGGEIIYAPVKAETRHIIYTHSNANIVINGGTFKKEGGVDVSGVGGGGIYLAKNAQITIYSGVFNGANGDINYAAPADKPATALIYGGTYSSDVSAYVAEGYELKANDNGTFVVEVAKTYVAEVGGVKYVDIQEAIKVAAPAGTVEILTDVTVDKWLMMTEQYSIGGDQLINVVINGMVINGNGHTLTVKAIESAGNGNHLFDDARNLTVNDLTIVNESGKNGGIGLISGTISNVTFSGGVGVFPGTGNVVITDCNFVGGGDAIYFESERDNLVVTDCTFDVGTNYAIILRGAAKFINNTVTSGKVNVANSASGEISGNDFGDNRFKVYNGANATITGNTINNLEFSVPNAVQNSTFDANTMSPDAQAALEATLPAVVTVNDQAELQDALDNCKPGTTIQLVAGVNYGTVYLRPNPSNPATKAIDWVGNNYVYESYTCFEDLTIKGAEGAIIDAIKIEGGTYYNTEHSQAATYPVMLSLIELKNVTIEGVTFTGNGGQYGDTHGNAISMAGSNIKVDGLTLENCVLQDSTNNNRLLYKSEATGSHTYTYNGETYTFVADQKNITVTGCTFNGGYMGMELRETENVTITGNTFNGVSSRDILLTPNTGSTFSGKIIITGNTSDGAGNRFVRASGIGNAELTISNNTIKNYKGSDADFIKADGVTGSVVTIADNTFNGEVIVAVGENGTYKVMAPTYVASVNGVKYESLQAAIKAADAGDTITLLADIEASAVIMINKSITINGNDHKVTSSATRVFRVTVADTEVTLNGVNMVSTAVRVGTNDVRGISIDDVKGVTLTLNNCSVDFTDETATDWAYAVNVTGGSNHTLTVNGGTYEGANVINVRGANHTVTVQNATLNCTYPQNSQYEGACVWVQEQNGSSVTATGNTFTGTNAVALNIGIGTELTESNNTDNTAIWGVAKIGDQKYASLAEALAAAQDGDTVKLLANISSSAIIVLNKAITLDGNGKKLTSTAGRAINVTCEGEVTIKNLTIIGAGNCERGINVLDATGITNIENVTVTVVGTKGTMIAVNAFMDDGNTEKLIINIKNSTLTAGYYAVQAYADCATYNIENSVLTGWAAIKVCEDYVTVNVTNSELIGINPYPADQRQNEHSTISITRNCTGTDINVTGGSITAKSEQGLMQAIFGHNSPANAEVVLDSELILIGEGAKYLDAAVSEIAVSVRAEYADGLRAEGYAVVTANGMTTAVVPVAMIGNNGYATLAVAIAAAKDGDTITLLTDIVIDNTNAYAIMIQNKSITIDGQNHTITQAATGKNDWALLYFDNCTSVVIKNVVFDGIRGGAAIWAMESDITVEGCTFRDGNYTQIQGIVRSTAGNLKVVDSKFINNTCSMAITFSYDAGSADDKLIVSGCTFDGNTCSDTAVVYHVEGTATIEDNIFKNNKVTSDAAAVIYLSSVATVSGNAFVGNTVTGTGVSNDKCGVIATGSSASGSAINGNAFSGNTVTTTGSNIVATAWVGSNNVDLNGNYWGGNEPEQAAGKDVYLSKAGLTLENYYKKYVDGALVDQTNIKKPVAEVNGEKFESFADAIAYANELTSGVVNITLLENVEFDGDDLYVDMVLDLNGKTITATGSYVFWFEGGSLTVKDSSAEKTGMIDGSETVGNVFLLMGEESLTIESGKIHANNNVIYAYGDGVTVVINGGELKSYIDSGNIFYLVGANDTITVNGGTFIGNVYPYASGLTIYGGLFTADVNAYCAANRGAVKNGDGMYEIIEIDASNAAAQIGDKYYLTLGAAINAAGDNDTIYVLKDVTESLPTLRGKILPANGSVTITATNSDWLYCAYTFVIGEGVTLNVPALFYYAGNSVIEGTVIAEAYYQRYAGTKLTIKAPGSLTVTGEQFYLRYVDGDPNAGIYVVGDNDDSTVELKLSVAYFYQGMINAKDATIKVGTYWQTNETDGQGSANLVLDNSSLDVTVNDHSMMATGNSTVTLKNGSAVSVANGYQGVSVSMDATSTFTKNGQPIFVAKIGDKCYNSLQAAIDVVKDGETIVLLSDLEVIGETFTIADGKAITLDMNGKKITTTDNKAANVSYELFYIYGGLTVIGNGTIELTSTSNDTAWAKSSTIFHNRGGVLTIENGSFTHKGGTAMAFVVDNNANSYGDAYLYVNGGEIISENYIAIRMRMEDPNANGNPGNGISYAAVTGGYIYGANRGIWGQKSSGANEKQGELTVAGGVVENGRADRGAIQIDVDSYEAQNMLVSISGDATIKGAIMGGDDEFVVSGGTFTKAVPEEFCAEGYIPTANTDGTYGVKEGEYVAQIGDVKYESLAEAFKAGGNIVLLKDVVADATIKVERNTTVTLDLNGKTIDAIGHTRIAIMSYGNLTIKDTSAGQTGTIKAGKPYDNGNPGGNAINVCAGTFILESGNIYSQNNGILIDEQAATVIINGGTITAEPDTANSAAFYVSSTSATVLEINGGTMIGQNGILLWNNTTIKITGGTLTATELSGIQGNGSKDITDITISGGTVTGGEVGIYHPQGGKLAVAGGTITGDTGIVVKGGNVTISGGTIKGVGEYADYTPKSSGYVGTGDALYIEHYDNSQNSENYGTPVVTVTGGTFTSVNGKAVASYSNPNNNVEALTSFVSGGTFNTDVSELCADGFVCEQNADGTYGIAVDPTYGKVAKIGDTCYATLAEALAAAQDGDVIEIIADVIDFEETAASIVVDKAITIKGAGVSNTTLNFNSATSAFVIQSSSVTFSDMTITQGTKSNSFHISIDKGAWDAPKNQYSDITIQNVNFVGGNYALCLIGEDVVVDSCVFTNQSSHNILVYSLKGDSQIINNVFNASTGSNKSAILYEGGADNATDLSGFIGGGTLTINGNEAYDKGVFFQFTSWGLIENMTLEISENKVDGTTNKVIALYDMDGAITAAGNEFDTVVIAENVFTNTKSGRPILKEYTGTVVVNASGNYLGSDTPAVDELILGDKVVVDNYYSDEALTNLVALATPVAQIGDVKYATLAEAIAAAQNGDTIVLLADVVASETITVAGKSITLDLNGKTVSGVCNVNQGSLVYVENNAALTVKDSVGDGKITYAQGASNVGWTVDVKGKFVLESGTIELTGTWGIGYAVDVRPNSWGTAYTNPTIFEMNGGKLVSSDGAVRVASSSAAAHTAVSASFVMNDGLIDAAWDGVFIQQSDAIYDNLSFTMNGGTIESDLNPVRVYGPAPTGYVNGQDCMSIILAGGTMTYTGTEAQTWVIDGILRVGGGSSVETILANGEFVVAESIAQSTAAPEGFKWVETTGGYTLVECDYIAQIGDVKYESLAEAIEAAQNGQAIVLLSDIVATETITIPAGKTVTLDLNGKTISQVKAQTGNYSLVENDGNLTIKDMVGGGKISYTDSGNGGEYVSNTIMNRGSLVVESGTIENLSSAIVAANGYPYAIDTSIWGAASEVNTIINGGTISCANYSAIRLKAERTNKAVNVTVNDGVIHGTIEVQSVSAGAAGKLTVNGGELSNSGTSNVLYVFGDNNITAIDIEIAAGNFTGNLNIRPSIGTGFDKGIVSGGTFASPVAEELCAEGYIPADNGDGTYGVVVDPAYGKVAQIGNQYYATLAEAIAAAQAGDTIKLLSDVTLTSKLTISKAITIDGDGHSIIANHTAFILETNSDCEIKNVTLDTNNKAKGVKIASGNAIFDNITIPNSNKSDAITISSGASLTAKTYLKVVSSYTLVDARSGIITVEPGTVFDMDSWRANASPAKCDLTGAVDVNGDSYFAAYGSTTYYKSLNGITSATNLTLLKDLELSSNIEVKGTLNLNGHNLTFAENKSLVIKTLGATLKAPAGINITTTAADAKVVYLSDLGIYIAIPDTLIAVAIRGTQMNFYENLDEAIDYAVDGDVIKLIEDVELIESLVIPEGINVTLDLNGYDLAFADGVSIVLNAIGAQFVGPEGLDVTTSVSNGDVVYENGVYTVVEVVVSINGVKYESFAEAWAKVTDGAVVELLADISADSVIMIDKSVTINGNGHKITSSASRVFRVTTGDVKVTMNDLNMVNNAVRVGTNDIRGISIDSGFTGVELPLNNCSVDFTDASATDWSYAVNVVGGSNHTITINGGTYEGANVINIRGESQTVVVKDATLTSLYPDNDVYYGACIYVVQNQNSTVTATGTTFNGSNAVSFNVGYTPVTESNNAHNTTRVVAKIGNTYYTSLADALEAAQAGDIVTLLADVTASEIITINKAITLDGNGKTLTSTAGRAINVSGADGVTIKNLTINASGERAINVIQNATNVTIENVTATAASYTVNVASSASNAVVAIKNSELTGLNVVNVAAAGANVTVDGGKLTCNDQTEVESYAALVAASATITATGVAFDIKGDSYKAIVVAQDGTITIDGTTEGVRAPVAMISYGDNAYVFYTLADAIETAKAGETITLIRDVAASETITVAGKSITLDLNGKTVSGVCNADQSCLVYVENNAALTVKDSSNPSSGKLTYAQGSSKVGWTVDVKGAFVLESGTIELTGTWDIGYAVDVRPNSWGTAYTNPTTFVMNGGKLVSSDGAVRVASSSAAAHTAVSASFVMNDGLIDAAWDGVFIQQGDAIYDDLSFTMNGGTIESDLNPVRVYGPAPTSYVNGQDCMSIILAGGTMTYTGTEPQTWVIDGILRAGGGSSVETILENGEFVVAESIAQSTAAPEGFKWVETTGGYTLVECDYVAQIGDVKYESLAEAIEAAQANDTIVLIADVEATDTITIPAGKIVTLDLNGKTISQTKAQTAAYQMILNDGNLTIRDTVGGGKISYTDSGNGGEYVSDTIMNRGNLTVEGGTIENLSSATVAANGYPYAIDTSIWGPAAEVNTVINGGKVYCQNYSAMRLFGSSVTEAVNVTVNGGEIVGTIEVQNAVKDAAGKLTISGGKLSNSGTANVLFFFGNNAATALTTEVTGGEFTGAIKFSTSASTFNKKFIAGGMFATKPNADYCAEGFTPVKVEGGYSVGILPDAEVTNLGAITVGPGGYTADMYKTYDLIGGSGLQEATVPYDLTLAMDFKAKDTAAEAANNKFGGYTTDFFIKMDGMSQASFVGDGCYLAGYYPSFNAWVKIPLDGFTVENGKVYPVITSAGFDFKYTDICDTVGQFICGIYLTPEVLAANPNLTVDLTLGLAENKDAALNAEFVKVDNYVYDADDLMPVELPEVKVLDIKDTLKDSDPDLTFALNFAIKDADKLTDAYLEKLFAKYGNYYTDYVLTISGLTDSNGSVKFNANGNGDGYLAGQYDAWSENWVSVPFEDVTVQNGQSLYIMEYAARLMGKQGLRFTLAEVAEIVQNFDCGVYFTPEFLAANPNLKVDLELKVFTEDATGNKVDDISVAKNEFDKDDFGVAAVVAEGKQTRYFASLVDAVAAANDGETVTLLADVAASGTITVARKSITLDLNGKTVSGVCNVNQGSLVYVENNAALTVKDSVGNGKITYAQGASKVGWTVDVKGEFVLESGTIELTGTWGIGYAVDVRPNSWGTAYTNPTIFEMNGGNIVSSDGGVRVASSSDSADKNVSASFVMNGGTIDAAWDGVFIQQSDAIYDNLNFTITGGTIESDLNPVRVYGPAPTGYVNGQDCMDIALKGGTLKYTGTETYEWVVAEILRAGGGSTVDTIVDNGSIVVSEAIATTSVAPTGFMWMSVGNGMYTLVKPVAMIGDNYYATLADAFDAVQTGDTIKLLVDLTVTGETFTIAADKVITLDMNGKKITATDNKAANVSYELFYIYGGLTVTGNGTIELTSTSNDTAWAKSSTIFHNRGGVLTVENGTFTHLGGTAMAYVVDNNANSFGDATAYINGGTLTSSYIAIRNRMDTYGANGGGNGVATLNISGGDITGKYAVWGQVASTGAKGVINISGGTFTAAAGKDSVLVGTDATGEINTAISGGIFTSDVSEYCADGFVLVRQDAVYAVIPRLYIKMVGEEPRIGTKGEVNALRLAAKVNLEDASWVNIEYTPADDDEDEYFWVKPTLRDASDNKYCFFKVAQ